MTIRTGQKAPLIELRSEAQVTRSGCQYSDKWASSSTYPCPHAPPDDKVPYCIFHDHENASKNEDIVRELKSLVKTSNNSSLLIGQGNYKLAIMYFDKALSINPKNIAAITGKNQALAALNQPK